MNKLYAGPSFKSAAHRGYELQKKIIGNKYFVEFTFPF